MTNTEIKYILKQLAKSYLKGDLKAKEFDRLYTDYWSALPVPYYYASYEEVINNEKTAQK